MIFITTAVFVCLCWSVRAGLVPTVPDHVFAVQGSCALISCSFPSVNGSGVGVAVRLRYRPSNLWTRRQTAFSSDGADQTESKFKGRITLSGDLSMGNCSLTINDISTSDPDTYELELRERRGSWGRATRIHVSVTRVPEPPALSVPSTVVLGQTVILNCSVRINCPLAPPRLLWEWERGGAEGAGEVRGTERVQTEGGLSSFISSLSFTPSELVKPRIRCDAHHHGNRRSSSFADINIQFPPMDVSVEVHTVQVREGGSVQLVCVCKADPPVIEYQWSYTHLSSVLPLHHHTHSIRLHNVTRHTRVQCTARNALGHATSPYTHLNVQYAPMIVENASVCVWDAQVQECVCVVHSNPRPLITWSVNGSVPPPSFNVTSSHTHHTLQETLRGHTHTPLSITCYAFNHLGNDTHTLWLQRGEGSLMQHLMSVGFSVLLLILLFIAAPLFVCLCRRRTGRRRRGMGCASGVYPRAVSVYQERTPLYINCSEVTHIYTNGSYQLIYQNCTPCFIRTTQTHKRQRRGARRERDRQIPAGQKERERQTPASQMERERQLSITADSDSAIYVEVI
ncbi:sialic acid-binding Ig-like lectin 10 [Ictalurus punctatus]|uniref:Sialic acid-binding Ig-like lectin 10 n=1 Tax=Ictalurus punctatus TaxID=7998 RepID=A0A2D0SVT7_ICTPU|nr:sialic acid-binding Ig-like lectin 10 [Ictalurus punctatus]